MTGGSCQAETAELHRAGARHTGPHRSLTSWLGDLRATAGNIARAIAKVFSHEEENAANARLNTTSAVYVKYLVARHWNQSCSVGGFLKAKEQAEARQLPVMDEAGNLHRYSPPTAGASPAKAAEWCELAATCYYCAAGILMSGERKADAIQSIREAGWAWDELG